MKKVNSIEHLKTEALSHNGEYSDFYINLNFGVRSSKRILYEADSNTFCIHNEIDDSYQDNLTEDELRNETHIVIAIEQGALFKYGS
jgi:hypothetical protein